MQSVPSTVFKCTGCYPLCLNEECAVYRVRRKYFMPYPLKRITVGPLCYVFDSVGHKVSIYFFSLITQDGQGFWLQTLLLRGKEGG